VNRSKTITVPAVSRAATASTMIYITKEPFDAGAPDFTCRGFNFSITIGDMVFKVRNYHDAPGEFTVISPKEGRQSPQARKLVDYLAAVLGGQRMFFYDGRSDKYQEVNLQTLEFKTHENSAVQRLLKQTPVTLAVPLSRACVFIFRHNSVRIAKYV
jgi:hypothetical protein